MQAFLIIKDVLFKKKIYIYIMNLNLCVKPNVTFEDIMMWSLSFQRSTVREKMIFTFHALSVLYPEPGWDMIVTLRL